MDYLTILMIIFLAFSSPVKNHIRGKDSHIEKVLSGSYFIEGNRQTSKSFQNDICLPAKLCMLSETQNDIFVEPLIKRWRPYNDVVRFSGLAGIKDGFNG